MTSHRRVLATCSALLVLGLALAGRSIVGTAAPRPAEATAYLGAASLAYDGDLALGAADVARGERAWASGATGLALHAKDAGRSLFLRPPLAWSFVAAPWVRLAGPTGAYLLNAVLLLALAALLARWLPGAGGAGAAFLLVSSALAGSWLRLGPELLRAVLLTAGLGSWLASRAAVSDDEPTAAGRGRWRPWLAGAALGAAVWLQPLDALLALAPAVDLLRRRERRALLSGLLGFGLVLALGGVGERFLSGAWPAPFAGAVRLAVDAPPSDADVDALAAWWSRALPAAQLAGRPELTPVLLARSLAGLLWGASGGLLGYLPFALVAAFLWLRGPRERSRATLALAFVPWLLGAAFTGFGEPRSGLGSTLLAGAYPAFLLLAPRWRWGWTALAGGLAAALWTAPATLTALAGAGQPASFDLLPLELDRLRPAVLGRESLGLGLPGYRGRVFGDAVWWLPERTCYLDENHRRGVWVRGESRSRLVVIAPGASTTLPLSLAAVSPRAAIRLEGGGDELRVRFDSEGKRQGVAVALPVRAVATDRGSFFPAESYYLLDLAVDSGGVPARLDPRSRDRRYLGVFLDIAGEGR